jgi:hypothetical protein
LLGKLGCFTVNRPGDIRADIAELIYGLAEYVEDTTEGLLSDWYGNRLACVANVHAALKTICGVHSDGTNTVLTKMLGDLEGKVFLTLVDSRVLYAKRSQNVGQIARAELHVDDWSHDLLNNADVAFHEKLRIK